MIIFNFSITLTLDIGYKRNSQNCKSSRGKQDQYVARQERRQELRQKKYVGWRVPKALETASVSGTMHL